MCFGRLEKESTWPQFDALRSVVSSSATSKLLASPQLPPNHFTANLESTPYPCSFAVTDAPKSSLQYVLCFFFLRLLGPGRVTRRVVQGYIADQIAANRRPCLYYVK